MRPRAIVLFERIYLLTLLLGAAQSIRLWPRLAAMAAPGTVLLIQLMTFGLTLLLVLLTARRRSKVAATILLATFLIGLPVAIESFGSFAGDPLSTAILAGQILLQAIALVLLVTPTARTWLWSAPPAEPI